MTTRILWRSSNRCRGRWQLITTFSRLKRPARNSRLRNKDRLSNKSNKARNCPSGPMTKSRKPVPCHLSKSRSERRRLTPVLTKSRAGRRVRASRCRLRSVQCLNVWGRGTSPTTRAPTSTLWSCAIRASKKSSRSNSKGWKRLGCYNWQMTRKRRKRNHPRPERCQKSCYSSRNDRRKPRTMSNLTICSRQKSSTTCQLAKTSSRATYEKLLKIHLLPLKQ